MSLPFCFLCLSKSTHSTRGRLLSQNSTPYDFLSHFYLSECVNFSERQLASF